MRIFIESRKKLRGLLGISVLTVALGGCITGGEPFAYTEIHEIPSGPGLISGDEGGYSIKLGGNRERSNDAPRETEQPAPHLRRHGRMQESVTRQYE